VPRGFVVTVDAYRAHCAESGLDALIAGVLQALPGAASDDELRAASARIRTAFRQTRMTGALARQIADAYEELSARSLDINAPVAVRSSATGEDGSTASFAGIFDTYLGISGPDRVLDAIGDCWGSLFTHRALAYRHERGISHHRMPIAVGVMELVHARAAGVAFSAHPVTGKTDRIVIEASWGWGEAVVQGLVTPDHAEIGKTDSRLLRYDVGRKDVASAFDFAEGRVTEVPMPARLRDRRVLDDGQIRAVCDAVRAIERHYGYPVDVEWVLGRHRAPGDPVDIVQTRPVTVSAPARAPSLAGGWDPAAFATRYAFQGSQ
ncbi:MAG TPA: PEP/pyruvate-binding domain-containing protein, partial [Trebonia sp.]|nr:PEP/pyruvate-binding domain-containing protein [Trebonia sp.]